MLPSHSNASFGHDHGHPMRLHAIPKNDMKRVSTGMYDLVRKWYSVSVTVSLSIFCSIFIWHTYLDVLFTELKMGVLYMNVQLNDERVHEVKVIMNGVGSSISIYISVWIDPNRSFILLILKHFSFSKCKKKLCLSETIQNNCNDSHTKSIFS